VVIMVGISLSAKPSEKEGAAAGKEGQTGKKNTAAPSMEPFRSRRHATPIYEKRKR